MDQPTAPAQAGEGQSREDLAKRYEIIRIRFFLCEAFLSLCVVGIFSLGGPAKWLAHSLEPLTGSGIVAAAVFTSLCYATYALLFLPLDFAGGFCLEHRFGLSNQKWAGWVLDQAKSFLLSLAILNVFAAVVLMLLRYTGEGWWIWAGCFWLVVGVFLQHLYPILIMPLFYKIIPLDNEGLKRRLLDLAQRGKVRVVGIYQFNMSKKTKKANACFAGLGSTKRILLGDTLLSSCDEGEIASVLAHEMGHCVHRHIFKLVGASTAVIFAGLWLVHLVLKGCVEYLGFGSVDDIAALPLIGFLLSVLALIALPLSNAYSRRLERQADWYALTETGDPGAFRRSMEKLSRQNLSNPHPHPVVEFFLYGHPSMSRRIRMAEEFERSPHASAAHTKG